jgi:hypothetical protein
MKRCIDLRIASFGVATGLIAAMASATALVAVLAPVVPAGRRSTPRDASRASVSPAPVAPQAAA